LLRYHRETGRGQVLRIAVVAPSNMLGADVPAKVQALASARYGAQAPEIIFHQQCFMSSGHFAGPDKAREDALVDVANDPRVDAVWCARGGYGANRIAARAIARMGPNARNKPFLGYSDAGFLLAGLLAKGIGRPVHAPMPADINRSGGDATVARSLDWLMRGQPPRLEYFDEAQAGRAGDARYVAFNLIVFSQLVGTSLQPDLTDRVLMLEETDEPLYRIDRSLFHVTSVPGVRRCTGLMLGRCDPVKPNSLAFGDDEDAIVRHWCAASGIPYLGRADIGHDADNKVVPFG
jgi:muramoyltetrapeptide carboxypeptidase